MRKIRRRQGKSPDDIRRSSRRRSAGFHRRTAPLPQQCNRRIETDICSVARCSSNPAQWHSAWNSRRPAEYSRHRRVPVRRLSFYRRIWERTHSRLRCNSNRSRRCRSPSNRQQRTCSRRHTVRIPKSHRHRNGRRKRCWMKKMKKRARRDRLRNCRGRARRSPSNAWVYRRTVRRVHSCPHRHHSA